MYWEWCKKCQLWWLIWGRIFVHQKLISGSPPQRCLGFFIFLFFDDMSVESHLQSHQPLWDVSTTFVSMEWEPFSYFIKHGARVQKEHDCFKGWNGRAVLASYDYRVRRNHWLTWLEGTLSSDFFPFLFSLFFPSFPCTVKAALVSSEPKPWKCAVVVVVIVVNNHNSNNKVTVTDRELELGRLDEQPANGRRHLKTKQNILRTVVIWYTSL